MKCAVGIEALAVMCRSDGLDSFGSLGELLKCRRHGETSRARASAGTPLMMIDIGFTLHHHPLLSLEEINLMVVLIPREFTVRRSVLEW
jgi:hypothetical protein